MLVYVLLKEVTWKYPASVIGVYSTKEKCINAMINDINDLYSSMDEQAPNLDHIVIKSKVQLGEDIWIIHECEFN